MDWCFVECSPSWNVHSKTDASSAAGTRWQPAGLITATELSITSAFSVRSSVALVLMKPSRLAVRRLTIASEFVFRCWKWEFYQHCSNRSAISYKWREKRGPLSTSVNAEPNLSMKFPCVVFIESNDIMYLSKSVFRIRRACGRFGDSRLRNGFVNVCLKTRWWVWIFSTVFIRLYSKINS